MRVGVAEVDISPNIGVKLGGIPYHPRPNKGVHNPPRATCLTLDHGQTCLAMVCIDIIGYPKNEGNRLRQDVAKLTGISAANIMVSCSHTHSAPNTNINDFLNLVGAGRVVTGNSGEHFVEVAVKLVKSTK